MHTNNTTHKKTIDRPGTATERNNQPTDRTNGLLGRLTARFAGETESGPRGPTTALDADTLLTLVANERRRYVIGILADHGGRIAIGQLAERVAAHEYGVARSEVTPAQRKTAYVCLYQSHVPALVEAGVIEWDEGRHRRIAPGPELDGVAAVLDLVTDHIEGQP